MQYCAVLSARSAPYISTLHTQNGTIEKNTETRKNQNEAILYQEKITSQATVYFKLLHFGRIKVPSAK